MGTHPIFESDFDCLTESFVAKLMVEIDERDGLARQDKDAVDLTTLSAATPEVISRQATINIGTIGHVAHGKSTVVKAISGQSTIRYKNELERNITIKLGYSNAKIYKCKDIPRPDCYMSSSSGDVDTLEREWEGKTYKFEVVRHVSFVDCPGHDVLMQTMLNGTAVMDAAILLVASNESCPQPQTKEHLAAIDLMGLKHIIVLQNKIDLIKREKAQINFMEIRKFVQGTPAENSPIIPMSAQLKYNIDVLCDYLTNYIPLPIRDFTQNPKMVVIRSFDVNTPGSEVEQLRGGVCGGSLIHGVLKLDQEIEIRPGVSRRDENDPNGPERITPIRTKIMSLMSDKNQLQFAVPGGLIAVGTKCDPTLCRQDRMVGQILGTPGNLPDVYRQIEIKTHLLPRLLGVAQDENTKKKDSKIKPLEKHENLMLNIGSLSCGGRVLTVKSDTNRARVGLSQSVCTQVGEKVAISRRINRAWRLIGWGEIRKGTKIDLDDQN